MITWSTAYQRQRANRDFISYFGRGGAPLPASAFRPIHYALVFPGVVTSAATIAGPTGQLFPAGAVILGITAAAFQQSVFNATFPAMPASVSRGRRDLFRLSFQYSNDEVITPGGPVNAEALLGGGDDTIFPCRELVIPPSQTILTTVQTFAQPVASAASLDVHIVFHAMVPRAVG